MKKVLLILLFCIFHSWMVKRKQTFIRCNHWATGIFMTLNILMIHANYKYTGVG